MRVREVPGEAKPCDVIDAEFYNFVTRCGRPTELVELESGDEFRVCREHVEVARSA